MSGPLLIVVRGVPAPQGSKSAFPTSAVPRPPGRGVHCPRCKVPLRVTFSMTESSKRTGPWRELVKIEAHNAMVRARLAPITGPVVVAATFTLERPKAHYRTGKSTSHLLTAAAPQYPDYRGVGDTEKYARAVFDAMTDAGVWAEDCQVVDMVRCAKVYPVPLLNGALPAIPALADPSCLAGIPDADALEVPGCVIRVTRPRGWAPEPTLDQAMAQ